MSGVPREGEALPPDLEPLVALSAAAAARDAEGLRSALERATRRSPPTAAEEAILQLHLFLGFPASLETLAAWRDVSGRPAPPDPEATGPARWRERGEAVCGRVYAGSYDRLRENVRRLHPAIERWMVEDGYGKVLGRPGLGLAERELCVVAVLAATARERQLRSHLRGALHAGAEPRQVEAALEEGLRRVADPRWRRRARVLGRRVLAGMQ